MEVNVLREEETANRSFDMQERKIIESKLEVVFITQKIFYENNVLISQYVSARDISW
ncbi:MAG: hypothetical protein JJT76_00160 [Clostridiaceae bacterium]|nr:hypothetical protein [Clostridiaceae bacterium]